jgi:hypothetical protein
MKRITAFALIIATVFLAACSSGDGPETPAGPKATVYASGYFNDADWKELPCYWRNGNRISLSVMEGTSTGAAKAITASGGTIYIAGYSDMYHPTACYWAGGTRYDQAHFSEGAACISVDAGTVYTAVNNPYLTGPTNSSTNSGMYYANQTRAENLFGDGTYVKGISSISGSICAVGQNGDSSAACWLDTTEQGIIETVLFAGASDACAVYPFGNFNYIAGSVGGTFSEKPCYWAITLGTFRTDLDIGSNYGEALAIKVVDDLVYTAGWYNDGSGSGDIPCFWEGTTRIDLPKASSDSQATGIDVLDGIVYVSGWYSAYDEAIEEQKMNPCYWTVVDGVPTRTDLPGGYHDGRATGIVVVME